MAVAGAGGVFYLALLGSKAAAFRMRLYFLPLWDSQSTCRSFSIT